MIEQLNERAEKLGYEVVASELIGFPHNMGSGPWCRVLRDGEPCFKFSWRATEVDIWLQFRERDAASAS